MLLYYITDRAQFPGAESDQRVALLRRIEEAAAAGIDLIQLREKDLPAGQLERLAQEAVRTMRNQSSTTRLLINSRTDVALAVGADGVHLTSTDIPASDARAIWAASLRATDQVRDFLVGVSCHSPSEVRSAEAHGADFAVLAPIFEKAGTDVPAVGLEKLRITTQSRGPDLRVEAGDNRVGVPVLALGGVNLSNAAQCLRAGAAGLAGTRLFQEGKLKDTIQILRDSRYGFVARTPSSATLPTAKDYPLRYRRRLPHFQEDDRAVFITFKTNGSFHLTSEQRDIALRCCLHDHGNRYQLFAAVIMSNHVHLLLRPLRDREGAPFTLREILHALKGASAHFINRETGHKGPVWQEESFDHVIRGEDDFFDKLEYIESNPVTAGAVNSSGEYNWLWVADRL